MVADDPQGPAWSLSGPAGDDITGDRAEAEELFQFGGDAVVLAVQDFDVGQVEQVLGDGRCL